MANDHIAGAADFSPWDEDGRPLPPVDAYEMEADGAVIGPSEWFDSLPSGQQEFDSVEEDLLYASAGRAAHGREVEEDGFAESVGRHRDHQKSDADEAEIGRRAERDALFSRLNKEQREAVFAPQESTLVLAAAGSGKTSVLTARIARLVTSGSPSVPARSIIAVTFTNKAAQEMRRRLGHLLDRRSVNDLWVGTFHSLCNRLLRENAEAAGLPKTFAILDIDGQEAICRGILKDFGLTRASVKEAEKLRAARAQGDLLAPAPTADASKDSDAVAAAIAEVAEVAANSEGDDEFLSPAECARFISSRKERFEEPRPPYGDLTARSMKSEQLEAVYAEYQKRCARSSLLDFSDLLSRGVKLLEDRADVREKMRDRFQAILVDEFQDTNDIQYRWLSLLKGAKAHITAVGDDDQSIYAFRGARPENMALFLGDLGRQADGSPGRLIRLEQNYRSLPHVLDIANAVIARNTNRLGKVLRTAQADLGDKAMLTAHQTGISEAAGVARNIQELIKVRGVPPSEIAVLYRANQQSRLFESELNRLGIAMTVYGGFRFYERQEVKNVLAYLDLVADLSHDVSFARVANFPPRGLGERTIEELRQDASIKGIPMMEMVALRAVQRERHPASLGGAAAIKKQLVLEQVTNLIVGLAEEAETLQLHELIETTIKRSGLAAHYLSEAAELGGAARKSAKSKSGKQSPAPADSASASDNERLANMAELVSAARQFVDDHPEFGGLDTVSQLCEYLAHVNLMTSTSESDMNKKNTVSLMTVHSSKGLEFDHVFVTGLEEDVFPHARAKLEDDDRSGSEPQVVSEEMRAMGVLGDTGQGDVTEDLVADGPSIQEERRLLYVAITRARKTLEMSHCRERLINGEIKRFDRSRFVDEIPFSRMRLAGTMKQDASSGRGLGGAQGLRGAPSIPKSTARHIALIGTAGRDKQRSSEMTAALFEAMLEDARMRVEPGDVLVSGGAAWADHLAVKLFLEGRCAGLRLMLPAPLGSAGRFEGPGIEAGGSSGSAANYYHDLFRRATGVDGFAEIAQAIKRGALAETEPAAPGYKAMTVRNRKVASMSDALVAYTWSEGDAPTDGGTSITWEMAKKAERHHVSLSSLAAQPNTQRSRERLVA